jgi:outer membrane protein assembly factor BamB
MRCLLLFLLLAASASPVFAEDWPQLLGPQRNNTTSEKVATWKDPPRILWSKAMGEGNSSPVVAGGRVFLHGKVADREEEEVVAFDAATGELLWRSVYERRPFSSNTGNGPRTTPAVSLGRVYAYGVTGILTCHDAETGKRLWHVDVHKEFDVPRLKYGVTSSPLVEGNRVLVHVGGPGATIVAFDADTGAVCWKALNDPVSTSAPGLIAGPRRQVIFQTGLRLAALDALDGTLLWDYPLSDTTIDSLGALLWTGEVLFSSSVHFGGRGLRLEEKGGKLKASEMWVNEKLGSYYASAVPIGDGCFCMVTNTSSPGAHLCCVEAKTGKVRWSAADVADWHAGLIGTGDGKLLLTDGKGVLRLLAADPEKYHELARASVGLSSSVNPVLANGRLYLRDRKQVLCLEVGR